MEVSPKNSEKAEYAKIPAHPDHIALEKLYSMYWRMPFSVQVQILPTYGFGDFDEERSPMVVRYISVPALWSYNKGQDLGP